MCGSARTGRSALATRTRGTPACRSVQISSPLSSRMRRSTPCAAGCCGLWRAASDLLAGKAIAEAGVPDVGGDPRGAGERDESQHLGKEAARAPVRGGARARRLRLHERHYRTRRPAPAGVCACPGGPARRPRPRRSRRAPARGPLCRPADRGRVAERASGAREPPPGWRHVAGAASAEVARRRRPATPYGGQTQARNICRD